MRNHPTASPSDAPDFQTLFDRSITAAAEAPARVNLIGDHTDYNGGCVLPTVMPQRTRVELGVRTDRTVRAWTGAVGGDGARREFVLGAEQRRGGWIDYVQGATQVLARDGFTLAGFDARFESDVPLGAGLASSASMVVALLRALRNALRLVLSDVDLAMVAHRTETSFVGAPIGVMDQLICALGKRGEALFLDIATRRAETVPIPEALELIVIHSGVSHQHATGAYRVRRSECDRAAALLHVDRLRDVESLDPSRQAVAIDGLPAPLNRRVRHVVGENARVRGAVQALRARDAAGFGRLMNESHESLRLDYEATVDETDLLVHLARREPDILGARMTGGGFGGAVVMAAAPGRAAQLAPRIARAYAARVSQSPLVLLPRGWNDTDGSHIPMQGGHG